MSDFLSMRCRLKISSNMFLVSFLVVFLLVCTEQLQAQEEKLLTDKPGTFTLKKNALNGQGSDLYGSNCSCTNAESDAALKQLDSLAAVFRKIPMLTDIKGFDGICEIGGGVCNSKFGYGIQSWISFYFRTWSLRNGKEVQWKVEPPQWRFVVNMTERFCSQGFNVSNYSDAYNPDNPAFTPEKAKKTAIALREMFFLPGVKENVAPGIDRYDNTLVFFNPERPPYWKQVTVREVFGLLLDYWKCIPDKAGADAIIPILTREFNRFTENEKDGYAYFGSNESISKIGSQKNETPVMLPNPYYWNKSLARSAIQFMIMEIPEKKELEQEMNRLQQKQDGMYYKYRFLYETEINSLVRRIEK